MLWLYVILIEIMTEKPPSNVLKVPYILIAKTGFALFLDSSP